MTELVVSGSAYGNQYTISRQGEVDAITGNQWQGIIKNYQFVINQISKRVRWQGTMDFAVDIVTGVSPRGLLPSMIQQAPNDEGVWVNSARYEDTTGIDLNGDEPDLGFFIHLASDGRLKNFGRDVWVDPNPTRKSLKKRPEKSYDLASIITHEMFHSMGIAYDPDYGLNNRFTELVSTVDDKNYFVGENALGVFGGAVPLTDMVTSNSYDHLDIVNKRRRVVTVMPRSASHEESFRSPSELDFAILKDIGWNVI